MKKIAPLTYDAGHGYKVQKMVDGWMGYLPIDFDDELAGNTWASRHHETRASAMRSISWHRRQQLINRRMTTSRLLASNTHR